MSLFAGSGSTFRKKNASNELFEVRDSAGEVCSWICPKCGLGNNYQGATICFCGYDKRQPEATEEPPKPRLFPKKCSWTCPKCGIDNNYEGTTTCFCDYDKNIPNSENTFKNVDTVNKTTNSIIQNESSFVTETIIEIKKFRYFQFLFYVLILAPMAAYVVVKITFNTGSDVTTQTTSGTNTVYTENGSYGNLTRVTISGNHVLVPVTLRHGDRSVEASLVLDTGAETTVISLDVAERLEIDVQSAPFHVFHGIAGLTTGWVTTVHQVSVGSHTYSGLEVAVLPEYTDGDGLLGMDFLRRFKYKIDPDRQVIEWDEL